MDNVQINLGDLAKPAVTLIEKISDAVGVLYEPRKIRRLAKARADAELRKAQIDIEVGGLRDRAERRRIQEEMQFQENMESVIAKALPEVVEDATPESIERDWLSNYFNKSRIVSDEEMQHLWARILAGEANAPGTYSKRTVNFLSDLAKAEAELFTRLCGFVCRFYNNNYSELIPLVFDETASIFTTQGINFRSLERLAGIGLIRFASSYGDTNVVSSVPENLFLQYYGREFIVEGLEDAQNQRSQESTMLPRMPMAERMFKILDRGLVTGKVTLTRIGQELAPISGSVPVDGFVEYIEAQWKNYCLTERQKPS